MTASVSASRTAESWLAAAIAAEKAGQFFSAYDTAIRGLAAYPGNHALGHRAVLALARSGATAPARALFHELALERAMSAEPEIAALRARLLKDEAFATTDAARRRAGLAEAANAYEHILATAASHYPAINAATLWLHAGEEVRAAELARAAIGMAGETLECAAGDARFWAMASQAEAHLVLGEVEAARVRMREAVVAGAGDVAAVAVFARSFVRTARARGVADMIDAALRRPSLIHYTGHIVAAPGAAGRFPARLEYDVAARIATIVDNRPVEIGYGSLAAGADILFAEAILRRGGKINILLPFREEDFLSRSVRPAGEGWVERYRACRAQASSVRFATEDGYLGDDAIYAYTSRLAMGLAALAARHFFMPLEQVAVWDGGPARGSAGTAIDVEAWRATGRAQSIVPVAGSGDVAGAAYATPKAAATLREPRAMLFGDLKGFGALTDAQMPGFVAGTLGAIASALDRHRDALLFANTWGDGLFLVFRGAGAAASCALDLLETIERHALTAADPAARMKIRLGGHLGPVYELPDPILGRRNFFGAHVTRAARIEPVTPPNCVCVTDAFAAALALEHERHYACDYVGETELAKSFGPSRLFLLRRAQPIMGDLFPVQA